MQFMFGDCVLDPERRELNRGAKVIAVGPQVFDLLVYLAQNRERVVSKDGLLHAVGGGRIVSESTLTSHVNALRKAIGDSGEEQRLIRTFARRGFRFAGDVKQAQSSDDLDPLEAAPATPKQTSALALALPDRMQAGTALAHLFAGRFDTASSWAEKAFRDLPSFLMVVSIIAASHAIAGRTDEARRALHHLRQLDPTLRISNLNDWLPIHRPEDFATFMDGLRRAGLPE